MFLKRCLCLLVLATAMLPIASAEDWPMWRHDSSRLAVTSEQLDDANLQLHWKRQYAAPKSAWDKQQEVYCYGGPGYEVIQRLSFDIAYQPVVMGSAMYVGSMNSDWVASIDLATGLENWKFFTGGPVRFAPVAIDGKIYVGSDDGFMYCLDEAGQLLWKIQGGPTNRKILGNDRMISVWPVRGGAVVPTEINKYPNSEYVEWLAERIPSDKETFNILDTNDNVEEKISDGGMDLGSSDLELGREHTDEYDYQAIGLRFQSKFFGLPKDAVVNVAKIQFTVDETKGGTDPVTLRIYGELSSDSASFTGANYEVTGRSKTNAYVDWTVPSWDEINLAGADQQTPDISAVINEMVQHADWTAESPITIIVERLSGDGIRCAESFSGNGVGPVLSLDSAHTVEKAVDIPDALVDELPNPAYIAWHNIMNDPAAKYYVLANDIDDVEENSNGGLYTDSSDIEITHDGGEQIIGLRFTNEYFKIEKGASIPSAVLKFEVDETKSGTDPLTVKITGEKSGSSIEFGQTSEAYDVSSRTKTTAEVIWAIDSWTTVGDSGAAQTSPDISSIIEEIVACDDWSDGSAITIIIEYVSGDGIRCAESAQSGVDRAARLIIDSSVIESNGSLGEEPAQNMNYAIGNNDSLMFAAGSYPFEGTFTYSVDKETGEVKWCNDKDYMYFTKNPHGGSESYNGNGPQGYLAAAMDNKILVPNGRNRPACLDASTGELNFHMIPRDNGVSKGDGGYFCSTLSGKFYTNSMYGCKSYNLSDGSGSGGVTNYLMDEDHLVILAGDQYFEAGSIFGYIDHFHAGYDDSVFKVSGGDFNYELDARPAGLLAANGHLVVTTTDGWIYCFGEGEPVNGAVEYEYAPQIPGSYNSQAVSDLIASAGYTDGLKGNCVVVGLYDGMLVEGIARETDMTVVAFETDTAKVDALRTYFENCGLYGTKVHIIAEAFETADVPSYCAHVIASENPIADMSQTLASEIFRVLRPYGGTAVLNVSGNYYNIAAVNAVQNVTNGVMTLSKVGRLPGSDDWTHQGGNVQQTTLSKDELVKLPMGVQWFGGSQDNTNDKISPRHGHAASPQVVGGRYYIAGLNTFRCVDVYTGRVLWEKDITNLGQFSEYTDHQAGQLALGDHYIATEEKVYVLGEHLDNDWPVECLVLDAVTGQEIGRFALPDGAGWGMIAVYEDNLIACGYPMLQDTYGIDKSGNYFPDNPWEGWVYGDSDPKVGVGGMGTYNGSTSADLFVLNRHTGAVKWQTQAIHGFFHNSIVAGNGKLFVMDRINWDESRTLESRDSNWGNGSAPDAAEDYSFKPAILTAWNIEDGSVVWQKDNTDPDNALFGSWLAYSLEHDILLECQRASRDYWENHKSSIRMTAWKGADGSNIWSEVDRSYLGGPVIIRDDMVITQSGNDMGAVNLLTGELYMVPSGLTGEFDDFAGFKRYGCGTGLACTNILLFRSGNAGYYDLNTFSGTGNWGGFKSGCTINLMPANGLLVAPEMTRTCGCSYQFQTSVAMIHRPEVEQWSCNLNLGRQYGEKGGRLKHVGLNFGSIGDRVDEDGVLWMEYPFGEPAAGFNYQIPVNIAVDGGEYYRHHSLTVDGEKPWVAASGVEGASSITCGMYNPENACFKDTIARDYDITLYFAEPDNICAAGDRKFNISVNGVNAGEMDILAEAGSASKVVAMKLEGVRIADTLEVVLTPIAGETILAGVSAVLSDELIEGDLNNDGNVDRSDLMIIKDYRNQSADSDDDPRDLDGDGKITVLDMRKMALLMKK